MKARASLCLLALLLASGTAFAADFVMGGFDFQRSGATAERVAPPLALVWRFATDADEGITAAPVVAGEQVIFCAFGIVYSLDTATGQVNWQLDTRFDIRMTPLIHNGRVYVGNDNGDMYVLDMALQPAGDRILGVIQFGEPVRCDPVVIEQTMWVVTDRGRLVSVNLEDLTTKDVMTLRSPPKGGLAWDGEAKLYITGRDNLLHCIDIARDPKLFWAKNVGTMVTPVVCYQGQPIVATRNGVVGLKPTSGRPDWTVTGFTSGRGAPAVAKDKLYVSSRDENLVVIDLTQRKVATVVEMDSPIESAITVSDDEVYLGTGVGNIYCVDSETYEFKWYYRCSPVDTVGPKATTFAADIPPTIANGCVFVVTRQGSLFCFRPDEFDVGKPRLHLPQIVTEAVDGQLVVFDMVDDELRELLKEEAEADAPEGTEVTLPKDAEMVKVPGKQPTFRFETYLYDEGSGVPLDQIMVRWNGQPHQSEMMQVTPNDFLLTIDLMPKTEGGRLTPLRAGEHTIEITVPDFKGNKVTRTFTFEIDNNLPPIQPPAPQTGTGPGSGGLPGPGTLPGPGGPMNEGGDVH